MKSLYESLLTGKVSKPSAKIVPSSRKELQQLISEYIEEINPRPGQEVDLNWIDISEVDDLRWLFYETNYIPVIDAWKIDHVKRFDYMFAHNEHIVRSPLPVLQKKLLERGCYEYMFTGCTALEEPPVLPATDLTQGCYDFMFDGCTSLAEPPALPAKKLAHICYRSMFAGCTALVKPPELPATKLAEGCYATMFRDCSSLKVAPELPATKLATGCYYNMFKWCKSLTRAPELPATELASSCYYAMFQNCGNLRTKAKIPTGINLDSFTAQNMYDGCPCENK